MSATCKRKKRSSPSSSSSSSFRDCVLSSGAVEAALAGCLKHPLSTQHSSALDEFVRAALPSDPSAASSLVTAAQQMGRALSEDPDSELAAAADGSIRSAVQTLKAKCLPSSAPPNRYAASSHNKDNHQEKPQQQRTEWRLLADRLRIILPADDAPLEHPTNLRHLASERLAGVQHGSGDVNPTEQPRDCDNNAKKDAASSNGNAALYSKALDSSKSGAETQEEHPRSERAAEMARKKKEGYEERDSKLAHEEAEKLEERQKLEDQAQSCRRKAKELQREFEQMQASAEQTERKAQDVQNRLDQIAEDRRRAQSDANEIVKALEEVEISCAEMHSSAASESAEQSACPDAKHNQQPPQQSQPKHPSRKECAKTPSWGSSFRDNQSRITHTALSDDLNGNESVEDHSSTVEVHWLQLEGAKEVERVFEGAESEMGSEIPTAQTLLASVESSVDSAGRELCSIASRASALAIERQSSANQPAPSGQRSKANELDSLIVMAKGSADDALAAREAITEFTRHLRSKCGNSRVDAVMKALSAIEEAKQPLEDACISSEQRALEFCRRSEAVSRLLSI